jgi:hypothetical protein
VKGREFIVGGGAAFKELSETVAHGGGTLSVTTPADAVDIALAIRKERA